MNINNIFNLSEKLNSKFFFDHNIGKLTWFRTGGNAKIFIIVENNKELEIILNEIKNYNYYILGSGSNLLVRDNGYNGIIIKLGKGFNFCKFAPSDTRFSPLCLTPRRRSRPRPTTPGSRRCR